MLHGLIKIYVYESFTLICFMILGIISVIIGNELLLGITSIFIGLMFFVWLVTSRLIIRLIIEGYSDDEDRKKG